MNLTQILSNIALWNLARSSQVLMTQYLNQGNMFILDFASIPSDGNNYYHAYPAIANNQMVFYLINSSYDSQSSYDHHSNFEQFIHEVPVISTDLLHQGHGIPHSEATQRIANWNNYHDNWIADQILHADGIYQAFTIPSEDLVQDTPCSCIFSLRANPGIGPAFIADIVVNQNDNNFFDTVRPVPPFGQNTPTDESNFFLLSLAGSMDEYQVLENQY